MRFRLNPFLGFVRTMTVRKFRRKETSRTKKEKGKAIGGRSRSDGKTRRMNKAAALSVVVVALITSWLPHAVLSRENILKNLQSGGGGGNINRTGKAGPY